MWYAVLITLMACAAVFGAWHWFERRDHRGGHARHDAMHSPSAVAERVATESARECRGGRHQLRSQADGPAPMLLSGETPLLSGYVPQHAGHAPRHARVRAPA
jgi:hypothetical protein